MRSILPPPVRDLLELGLEPTSALVQTGWTRSRRSGMPIDQFGEPLPWYTYPAIRFLEQRTPLHAKVFEYGMGNSTLWWSRRVQIVESCEHDAVWLNRMRPMLPTNARTHFHPVTSDDYVQAALRSAHLIDILVIDGRRRVACARSGLARLSPAGVVLWDNTERGYYAQGYQDLAESGFSGRIDFWGMGPINSYEWCTSIFYRPQNCFGL